MTGEIWEDDLGFERPSFGPANCQASPVLQARAGDAFPPPKTSKPAQCGLFLPPSPLCPPTAGDQLGPCDLPSSARHQHPTQADMQWPNPILDKHQEATRGGFFFTMLIWTF